MKFSTEELASLSVGQEVVACVDSHRQCETASFYGHQTCNETSDGIVYGSCVFDQCKFPGERWDAATGQCRGACTSGESRSCTFQGQPSGIQTCSNSTWSNCACSAGFFYNAETKNCEKNFLKITGFLSPESTSASCLKVVEASSFKAIPNCSYYFKVEASPNLILVNDSVQSITSKLSSMSTGCAGHGNAQWDNVQPWKLGLPTDPNAATLVVGGTMTDQLNRWNYSKAMSAMMAGCSWQGTIAAVDKIVPASSHQAAADANVYRASVNFSATCTPGDKQATNSCSSGSQICSSDGSGYICMTTTHTDCTTIGKYWNGNSCVACTNGPSGSVYLNNGGMANSCSWSCSAPSLLNAAGTACISNPVVALNTSASMPAKAALSGVTVDEGSSVQIYVVSDQALSNSISRPIYTINAGASGGDYLVMTSTSASQITIPSGKTFDVITIKALSDSLHEGDEVVTLSLNASGSALGSSGYPESIKITIKDTTPAATVPPPPTTLPPVSSPGGGLIIGGGSCWVDSTGGCGGGASATWYYWGAGQSGGCASGIMQRTAQVAGGPTGFICLTSGAATAPGAVVGGATCTVFSATAGCGTGATSTWQRWGQAADRSTAGSDCLGGSNQIITARDSGGGMTGYLCLIPGAPLTGATPGVVLGGGSCVVNPSTGGCGNGATSTWTSWGSAKDGEGCSAGDTQYTAQVQGGPTGYICVASKVEPIPGTIIGGGSCILNSATGGCGVGSSSTWRFWGTGQSGGCRTGMVLQTSTSAGGVTGYLCVAAGTPTTPGAIVGSAVCVPDANGSCGAGATSTWVRRGQASDRLVSGSDCLQGTVEITSRSAGGPTGYICVLPGASPTAATPGTILGGGDCVVNPATGGCGGGATSTWKMWGSGIETSAGCKSGVMQYTAQVAGGPTGFVCVATDANTPAGTVLGGGTCTVDDSGAGCGVGETSTWKYWGMGREGGCGAGEMRKTAKIAGGATGFICVSSGTPSIAGAVVGGGTCSIVNSNVGCGSGASSTWDRWGQGADRTVAGTDCLQGQMQPTSFTVGGVTGYVCVIPGSSTTTGTVVGGASCTPDSSGSCGVGTSSTWVRWGAGNLGGCSSGFMRKTAQNTGGPTAYLCVIP